MQQQMFGFGFLCGVLLDLGKRKCMTLRFEYLCGEFLPNAAQDLVCAQKTFGIELETIELKVNERAIEVVMSSDRVVGVSIVR